MLHDWRHMLFNPATTQGAIAYGLAIFVVALLLSSLVGAWTRRFSTRPSLFVSRTSATFIGQLLRIAIFLLGAVT